MSIAIQTSDVHSMYFLTYLLHFIITRPYSTTLVPVVMNEGASLQNSEWAVGHRLLPQPDFTGYSQSARFNVSVVPGVFIFFALNSPNAKVLLQILYKRSCGCFCPWR